MPDGGVVPDTPDSPRGAAEPGTWWYTPLREDRKAGRLRRARNLLVFAGFWLGVRFAWTGALTVSDLGWVLAIGFLLTDPFLLYTVGHETGHGGKSWLFQAPGEETRTMLEARLADAVAQSKLGLRREARGTKKRRNPGRYHTWSFVNGFRLSMTIPDGSGPARVSLTGIGGDRAPEYRALKGLILANLRSSLSSDHETDHLIARVA
jgi:hypothetical protein